MKNLTKKSQLDEFLKEEIINPAAIVGGTGGIDRDKLDPPQNGEE